MIQFSAPIRTLLFAFCLMIAVLLYGPVILSAVLSLFSLAAGQIVWSSFGVQNYALLLQNSKIVGSLRVTLWIGLLTVLISCSLAVVFSLYARRASRTGIKIQSLIVSLPFIAPPIITGLSLLIFFKDFHIDRSLTTVVAAHTVFVFALVYRIINARLLSLGKSLFEAAEDLGATPIQTLVLVILPNMWGAIGSAAALAFALSFDETLITLLVGGTQMTLPIRLWSMMRLGFTPDINALVTLILIVSIFATGFLLRQLGTKTTVKKEH